MEDSRASLKTVLVQESHHLSDRGLANASKWLAELASVCIETNISTVLATLVNATRDNAEAQQPPSFSEKYHRAKRYFDCRELQKCAHTLKDSEDTHERWLWLYTSFLVAQSKATEDTSMKLEEINSVLLQIGDTEDGFLLYLKALVLAEAKQRQAAVVCLVESLKKYSFNWSAWLKLTELLDGEEEFLSVSTGIPPSLTSRLFYIHASLEVHRASEGLRFDIRTLETLFPGSVHLKAQHALCEYHMRDFDLAEKLFDELGEDDPFRLDELDTYSNILYVMGKSGKLAQIAQRYAAIDSNRPEVCCLIGNLYSLRGDHAKAIAMFRQSLRLDRGYLTAWTLMGHEYVEMSNTHAAIESYRKACQANRKDYRAWYGLGQAYELLGMHAYALQYFQKATALRPFDSRMWQALAQCYSKLAKPHEVLKCYKRAQILVEPNETSNLRQLGEHCLSMGLFDEAAMYWTRIVAVASEHELPIQEYSRIYIQLAAYEMGEHHVAQSRPRVIGELSLAEVYLSKVVNLNNEDADAAKKLQRKIRELQLA